MARLAQVYPRWDEYSGDLHQAMPVDPRERLAFYLHCDCGDCRRSYSDDVPVRSVAQGLLLPKAGKVGR